MTVYKSLIETIVFQVSVRSLRFSGMHANVFSIYATNRMGSMVPSPPPNCSDNKSLLPKELHDLEITILDSIEGAHPFNLNITPNEEIRHGTSSMVYRIENPYAKTNHSLEPFLACKKIVLNEDVQIRAVESEISSLLRTSTVGFTISLREVYYVPSDEGGSIYLILDPWLELSLQNFIMHLMGKSQMDDEKFSNLAPWYHENAFELWPTFISSCLHFLASLTKDAFYPIMNRRGWSNFVIDTSGQLLHAKTNGNTMRFETPSSGPVDTGCRLWDKIRHRDLKPDNILLRYSTSESNRSRPYLSPIFIDFGISRIHDVAADSSHTGTDAYRAPEQQKGSPPSIKSDTWSLGCCFTFIEAFIHSGKQGIMQIHETAVKGEKSFRDHIEEVNKILDDPPTQQLSPSIESVRKKLRRMVKEHMLVNVSERANPSKLSQEFLEIRKDYMKGKAS